MDPTLLRDKILSLFYLAIAAAMAFLLIINEGTAGVILGVILGVVITTLVVLTVYLWRRDRDWPTD